MITINSLLLLLALLMLVLILRNLLSGPYKIKAPLHSTVDATEGEGDTAMLERNAVILKKNPFGFDAGELTALTSRRQTKKVRTGGSPLQLIGTIAAGDGNSYAVFTAEGKQALYKVKETIPGLGVLDRVEPGKVLIRNGPDVSEMELAEIRGPNEGVRTGGTVSRPDGGKEEFVRREGDGSYVLNAGMVQESINNPQRLMTDARLLPRYKNGKQEGFVLREVKRGGIYESLGLRNGDILLRINEYDITNPETALQAFTALKGVERLQLDIIRNDTNVTQTYVIR